MLRTLNVDVIIGYRVRYERQKAGMTQRDLAAASGLSIAFLSDVENGKRGLSVLSLLKIADALGKKPQWFLRNFKFGEG